MKKFLSTDGKHEITRVSRWITIRQAYNVSKRNSLYEFCTDENGYKPHEPNFNHENGTFLDYFRFKGRNYAIEQFMTIGSTVCPGVFYDFIDSDGKNHFIMAVDFWGDLYDPYYLELDSNGERVRIYEIKIKRGC